MSALARALRLRLCRRAMGELYAERRRLAVAMRKHGDPLRPTAGEQHTRGMYDGVSHAIDVMESYYR